VKVFQNVAFTSALAFTIFIVVLEEIIFQNPQASYFFRAAHKSVTYHYIIMEATVFSISLLLFFAFIYISLSTKKAVRWLYFVLFTFAILSQYSYQNTFHRFMSTLDVYTAMNTPFGTWLDAASLFFNWLGFIPVMAYLILLWAVKSESKYGIDTFLLLFFLIVGINSTFYHAGFGQTSTISVPSYFKTLTNAVWERPVNLSRETIVFKSNESPQNNIVLIIDESIRGDHLSVNGYHRPTTPYLEQLSEQGYIHNWGLAASAASCSLMSNSVIVTGLLSLPDRENRRFQNPIIFQYAKAMGYKTYHYDAQTNYLWNSTSVSDLKYIDNLIDADIIGKDIESDLE
jgi:glucan phosphoethanolaminetransferase (alkaline phosphatase superfamily)